MITTIIIQFYIYSDYVQKLIFLLLKNRDYNNYHQNIQLKSFYLQSTKVFLLLINKSSQFNGIYFQPKPNLVNHTTFNILHLSDIHYDPKYEEGKNALCGQSACCRNDQGLPDHKGDGAGKWGDYRGCDTPKKAMEDAIQHIKYKHRVIIKYQLLLFDSKMCFQVKKAFSRYCIRIRVNSINENILQIGQSLSCFLLSYSTVKIS